MYNVIHVGEKLDGIIWLDQCCFKLLWLLMVLPGMCSCVSLWHLLTS